MSQEVMVQMQKKGVRCYWATIHKDSISYTPVGFMVCIKALSKSFGMETSVLHADEYPMKGYEKLVASIAQVQKLKPQGAAALQQMKKYLSIIQAKLTPPKPITIMDSGVPGVAAVASTPQALHKKNNN